MNTDTRKLMKLYEKTWNPSNSKELHLALPRLHAPAIIAFLTEAVKEKGGKVSSQGNTVKVEFPDEAAMYNFKVELKELINSFISLNTWLRIQSGLMK